MCARRFRWPLLLACICTLTLDTGGIARAVSSPQANAPSPAQDSQSPAQTEAPSPGSSSSQPVHRKTGANSSETIRHTRVAEVDSTSPQITQAENLIQKHDYVSAEPLLQEAVKAEPENYVAWFDLAFTESGLGHVDQSIAAYRKSVAAKPDVFESNLNLGIQLAKAGQPEAEIFLRAATQLTPTSHVAEGRERAWLSLAHVLANSKPDDAIAAYRQAATLQPKDPEPHVAAGQLLEDQGNFADAEAEYKRALALDPSSDALTGLANLYMRGRRFPEAEDSLRQLVAAHPGEVAARIQLGRVLREEGKKGDATTELQAAATQAPMNIPLQRELADLYTDSGKNDQAEAIYRSLLIGHPNDFDLHRALGQSLLKQKKFIGAQQEFLTVVKLKPDLGDAYADLAFAASENKDYALTIKSLDARAKLVPETPATHFLRASAYDHLKDFKRAAASYHLFLKTANGKYPDQEWQAKHRLIAIEPKK